VNITADYLIAVLAAYIWPFARLSAMLMTMLVFSSQSVPMTVRLVYSLTITAVLAPVLPTMPAVSLISFSGLLITIQQVLIGVAIGFISQMLLQAFVLAGQIISMQTSLGFASMVDPLNGESTPVVGQFYLMLGTLVFFAINGHLTMLQMLAQSFITLPISEHGLTLGSIQEIVNFISVVFQTALGFALSASVALLLINFTFGVMTRAAPQLNIFSMGFAVTMISGLFILWLTLSNFMDHFDQHWQRTQVVMCDVLGLTCQDIE